jgi:hypothetical protein
LPQLDREVHMAFARVVTFDGVTQERIDQIQEEVDQGRPEGLPATEILMLHDQETEKALVVVFFETEEDYKQGDATLDAMPAGDTPGGRTSVTKYKVAIHQKIGSRV